MNPRPMNPRPDYKYEYNDEEIDAENIVVLPSSAIIEPGVKYRALTYHRENWNETYIEWDFAERSAKLTDAELKHPFQNKADWINSY